MSPTNLFNPAPQHIGPTCPTHGQHQGGWINSNYTSTQGAGTFQAFQICGLCVVDLLRRLGYTVVEPEGQALKENDWILDELPEVKK